MNVLKIDKNFTVCSVKEVDYDLYAPEALGLEGFPWEHVNRQPYRRLPDSILPELRDVLKELSTCNAGGVIRFRTDSKKLLLKGKYLPFMLMPHMSLTGQAGFDVILREKGKNFFLVNLHGDVGKTANGDFEIDFSCELPGEMKEYRIFMPLYAGIEWLQIGLEVGARVDKAPPHTIDKPILLYGSSITQGACASRSSNYYGALLASMVDAEQINLGFSGNAEGEIQIAEAIGNLELSCFIMDYEFNAPSQEHLMKTHEAFFGAVREKQPELPIIIVSRPLGDSFLTEHSTWRKEVLIQTYINARKRGDKHVYFVDGTRFFEQAERELSTVDKIHPNDLGFYWMAKGILPTLETALKC